MFLKRLIPAALLGLATVLSIAHGAVDGQTAGSRLKEAPLQRRLGLELAQRYPGARIETAAAIRWTRGTLPEQVADVRLLNETYRGELQFVVTGEAGEVAEGWTTFSAWQPAYVASRRILPGERIGNELFRQQEVNVALGQAREFRGVILAPAQYPELSQLETRQTVLEGQFLMSSAVQKVPDIRRGDAVTIHLQSGDLFLTTQGIAQEPAYLQSRIRVMATKTKREVVGQLTEKGIVEVRL